MGKLRMTAALAASSLLLSCGIQQSVDDAAARVDLFHSELNAQRYDAIWAQTSPEFRRATSRDDLDKLLSAVHRKLGLERRSNQTSWNANTMTNGTFVTLQMDTTFEKGRAQEIFRFVRKGENLEMIGYNINSNDMLVN